MSLLLMVFYWTVIPGLVLLAAMALWRRADTRLARAVVIGGSGSILLGLLWLGVGRIMYYDAKVRELCAKDGGIKVYETVRLPAEKFDKYGNVRIPNKEQAKSMNEYYYERAYIYYRKGEPQITRTQHRVIRRSDGKILGESIRYSRGGGDLPGPWHGSSFICPPISKDRPGLEVPIFLRGDAK